MNQQIRYEDVQKFSESFDSDPKNLFALNAVAKSGIGAVALSRETVNSVDHTFSNLIETPEATNQKKSGRCWLFAGLNSFRVAAMKKMNLEKFELSQSYLMFWDKLEKANYFLENIIETVNEPLDGRLVMWLLAEPLSDGGQWDMFVNLIEKYGVVPKFAMPETESSSSSYAMNDLLIGKLREYARLIREKHVQGKSPDAIRQNKQEMLNEFYRMLCIHLGKPPAKFFWEWRDKDKKFKRHGDITPKEFFDKYVALDLDDMVCLINAPTKDKPFKKMYTVQYLGNIVGGHPVRYLNVELKTLKNEAKQMIIDEQPVWFGCDVGPMMEKNLGVLDFEIYNYELVLGTKFELDKAGRLDYGHSKMTHAMVFTGVDVDDSGKPIKWRVENSWGKENGDKGYLLMTDKWFDEYLYEVAVSKKYLSPELLQVLDTEPVVLPPWDPMGSLAR